MDYLNMPAGAGLDALVAKQVMGWRPRGYGHPVKFWLGPDGRTGWCDRDWPTDCDWGDDPDYFSDKGTWRPSTDIALAWGLIEKFNNAFGVTVLVSSDGSAVISWVDSRRQMELGYSTPREAKGETVALALCRAALKAMGASR